MHIDGAAPHTAANARPDRLRRLIYVSALKGSDESVLADILESAHRHNLEDHITGMLLYRDGNLLQVLEGPHDALGATFERIRIDPRHHLITVLDDEPVAARDFADWSMGFRQLLPEDIEHLPESAHWFRFGFNPEAIRANPGMALELLQMFARGEI